MWLDKEFWKTVEPVLSDKVTTFPKISLAKNGEIISDETRLPTHLVISLKMPYVHLVSKQTNMLMRIIV